jgi:hypothetical protein
VHLDRLESWTANADAGVKFFSGTARYRKTVQAPADWFREGSSLWLNLGRVGDIAEVSVNGRVLGTLWKAPYRIDLGGVLKPGENRLEIRITNEWTNRLIGDQAAPEDKKVLSSPVLSGRMGPRSLVLPEAGLIGPVTIEAETRLLP